MIPKKCWLMLLRADTSCHPRRSGMKEGKERTLCGFNIPAPAFPPPVRRGQDRTLATAVAGGNGWCPARCQRDAPRGLACRGRLSQPARLMRPNPDRTPPGLGSSQEMLFQGDKSGRGFSTHLVFAFLGGLSFPLPPPASVYLHEEQLQAAIPGAQGRS